MPTQNFYPNLGDLISSADLPESVQVVQSSLSDLLDKVFYKDLNVSKGKYSESAFYKLTLVFFSELGIQIPGTGGCALLFNPGSGGGTEIPVSLGYNVKILSNGIDYDIKSFDGSPASFHNLFQQIIDPNDSDYLYHIVNKSYSGTTMFDDFITDFDSNHSTTLNNNGDPDERIIAADLASQIEAANLDVIDTLFADYIASLSTDQEKFDLVKGVFQEWLGSIDINDIFKLFLPELTASVGNINLAIEFPRSLLIPLDASDEPIADESIKSILTFTAGRMAYSTSTGFDFQTLSSFSFSKSQIGQSGFTISFSDMKLDLSRNWNIAEIEDRPDDFIGVYVGHAAIGLPDIFKKNNSVSSTAQIVGKNLVIGTGGLSGVIGLESSVQGDLFHVTIGSNGFAVGLSSVYVEFQQNSITSSHIQGYLSIPGFEDAQGNPAKIEVDTYIGDDEFRITAAQDQGIDFLTIPNVLKLNVKSLTIGNEDSKFFIETSGSIELLLSSAGKQILESPIDIKGLRIWQDGKVELKGGSIPLPKALTLKVGPAKLSVTAIHFGSHEQMHGGQMREYNYFGFDGGVSLDPGGVDARGDGIKFYYTTDTDPANNKPFHYFLGIEGIGIAIKIPGTASEKEAALILKGYLAIKNPDDAQGSDGGKEYIGAVTFAMPWQPAEWPLSHAYTTHTKKLHKLHTASECFSLGFRCSSLQAINNY